MIIDQELARPTGPSGPRPTQLVECRQFKLFFSRIELRFHSGGIGNLVIQRRERVVTEKALAKLSSSAGTHWQVHDSNLEVCTYITADLCLITILNYSVTKLCSDQDNFSLNDSS